MIIKWYRTTVDKRRSWNGFQIPGLSKEAVQYAAVTSLLTDQRPSNRIHSVQASRAKTDDFRPNG